jgi:predicted transcriptional regulator
MSLTSEVRQRAKQFAAFINSGLRPMDARDRMGLTKGQAAHTLRQAKSLGLVEDKDHTWLRGETQKSAAMIRDEMDEMPLAEIAARLGVAESTVTRHWARIKMDLGWQTV